MFEAVFLMTAVAQQNPAISHSDCLEQTTRELEISGEEADIVSKSAVSACADLAVRPTSKNRLGSMTPSDQKRVLSLMRDSYLERTTLFVVKLRACRKQPNCNLSGVKFK